MRVALYIRVSTEEQRIHGLSIDAQTQALDAWAAAEHAHVIGRYVDAGITARKKAFHRPALQRLLDDVRADRIDVVVFTKLDRWFRNIAEYYKVQEVLEAHNVCWKATQEDYETTTASGRLKVNIMLAVAQDEADRTGERIKAVFESKKLRNEPISGKVPFGYKIDGKRIVPDPDTAPIAQDIFRQYVACRSIMSLRKYTMDKHGMVYSPTGLKMFLSNDRYIGRSGLCEPIIDRGTFDTTQASIRERGQRNSARSDRVYLFTGLVYCAECGNRLSAHTVDRRYIYYRCTKYEKLHLCAHKKRTSEIILEDWLTKNLLHKVEEFNARAKSVAASRPDETKIKRKMEKLKDLYLNDLIDRSAYEAEYIALRDALSVMDAPESQPVDVAALRAAMSAYKTLSRLDQKEFWGRVIKRITITNSDGFSIVPITPYPK